MLRRLLTAFLMLVGLWLVAVAILFVWPQANQTPPDRADAVVVLSGGGNGRLDPALELVDRGIAPVLAISSAFRDPRWRKAHRLCRGEEGPLRFRVLCFQAIPYSTRGEAETVGRLAREVRLAPPRRRHLDVPRDPGSDALPPLLQGSALDRRGPRRRGTSCRPSGRPRRRSSLCRRSTNAAADRSSRPSGPL